MVVEIEVNPDTTVVGRVTKTVLTIAPAALLVTDVFAVVVLGLAVAVTLSVSTVRPSKQEHAEDIYRRISRREKRCREDVSSFVLSSCNDSDCACC